MNPPQTQRNAPELSKIKKVRDQIGMTNRTDATENPPDFQAMVEKWQETPSFEMSNLFSGRPVHDSNLNRYERGFIFKVDSSNFPSLLNPSSNPVDFKLRIHLSADPNYKPNKINAAPAFVPLIQGIDSASTAGYDNTFETTWMPANIGSLRGTGTEQPISFGFSLVGLTGEVEIDSRTADQFMLSWLNVPDAKLGAQFESAHEFPVTARVRYFTFGVNDAANIKNNIEAYGNTAELFIYLGSFATYEASDFAFDFCTIIEVRGTTSNGTKKSHFYEFGSPCPPAC